MCNGPRAGRGFASVDDSDYFTIKATTEVGDTGSGTMLCLQKEISKRQALRSPRQTSKCESRRVVFLFRAAMMLEAKHDIAEKVRPRTKARMNV